jgi:hypothetical protein
MSIRQLPQLLAAPDNPLVDENENPDYQADKEPHRAYNEEVNEPADRTHRDPEVVTGSCA